MTLKFTKLTPFYSCLSQPYRSNFGQKRFYDIGKLLTSFISKHIRLSNRVVMAPMNRRRAYDGIPGDSMITYYKQRASADLIITDNTAVAANGGAYLQTPGIYNSQQISAWKKVTDAVHAKGGKIVMQLVHSGRVGHPLIQNGAPLVAPSALKVNETIRVPNNTYQPMAEPLALKAEEIPELIRTFKQAAGNAMEAGFDGVEVHAAHGFLIDQFLNPHSNQRTDDYGGNLENRCRFLLEVIHSVTQEIGTDRTGIRLSPFLPIYDIKTYPQELTTHQFILSELQKMDILYVHFSNAIIDNQQTIPLAFLQDARQRFKNLIMIAGGLTIESGETLLKSGLIDLVAFGKLFISNPDLVDRIKRNVSLANWDEKTFYQGDDKGYIDYPKSSELT